MIRTVLSLMSAGLILAAAAPPTFPVTEAGAPVLRTPTNARSVSMGLSGVADAGDPANVFYNPANVLNRTGVYANGAYRKVPAFFDLDDMWFGAANAGAGYRISDRSDFFSFGFDIGWTQFDYGTSVATDDMGFRLGEFHSKESAVSVALGAGVSFRRRYRLMAGSALRWWRADYAPASSNSLVDTRELSATAYDLGTVFAVDFPTSEWTITPAVGLAYLSGGSDFESGENQSDPLPTRVTAGVSVRAEGPGRKIFDTDVPLLALTQNVDWTDWAHGDRTTLGIGLEAAVLRIAYLRLGYYRDDELEWNESTWGVGIGLPVGSFNARFDYTRYPFYGAAYYLWPDTGTGMYNLSISWVTP